MNIIARASLYWHTLRFLRPVQFFGRLWFRFARPRIVEAAAPPLAGPAGRWVLPACRSVSMSGFGQFRFLNDEGDLTQIGWDDPAREKLWRYNLHYFDDLNAEGAASRYDWHLALLQDWVGKNLPGQGTGWEPYPSSLRIVNWIKWQLAGNALPQTCVQSLAMQTRWLSKRLEWHLMGNHLFANAKALVFAGLAFEGAEAKKWLANGLDIIERELPEQVLADGGNFERSPMYHAIFLEDMLDLLNIVDAFPERVAVNTVRRWHEIATSMLGWLVGMSHPDGEISFFNDAAAGIAPMPAELTSYAGRLGIAVSGPAVLPLSQIVVTNYRDSGYIRLASPDIVALLDVAPVGPDYLPGHAHADTLSFELSIFGQRLIVNGGTSCYGLGPERLRERGTAAHSTVVVDGKDSSEVWSGFRVARRAYPRDLELNQTDEMVTVACSHDGYRWLPGQPVHRREWRFTNHSLLIRDHVSGRFESAEARYLLHPAARIVDQTEAKLKLQLPQGQLLNLDVIAGTARLESAQYAPEFGMVQTTSCIVLAFKNGSACINLEWS
ncbi:heparinase II/III family protein [Undibacterium sp. Jales W-56]|uniref:heparinase II/III family protein n=1 Tax=Undibacterium sp. Jales W-56 TaxID=2897325 RepID=UPI0021CFF71B|nr:heparinase II/III family protein [Undibacterium sp. Jales W-56]MCU6433908.1 heparinase II/III family protein [Undibacterium sp. Jales W-56]